MGGGGGGMGGGAAARWLNDAGLAPDEGGPQLPRFLQPKQPPPVLPPTPRAQDGGTASGLAREPESDQRYDGGGGGGGGDDTLHCHECGKPCSGDCHTGLLNVGRSFGIKRFCCSTRCLLSYGRAVVEIYDGTAVPS